MTNRGEVILQFIRQYQRDNRRTPTYREIAAGCGLQSASNVGYWLDGLEASGKIKRFPKAARSIIVIPEAVE